MSPAHLTKFKKFKETVWKYYRTQGRHDLPWRKTRDPYKILVSEIMLQQTQVSRVLVKYPEFLRAFPTVEKLASAPTHKLLSVWQGLGYNRRALALKRAAEIVAHEHAGKFPKDFNTLVSLPGIGPATAADMLAFAWNISQPLIETNIRTVYIHHFFAEKSGARKKSLVKAVEKIHDRDILPLVEKTFDAARPREWIWALMDYGAMLKREHGNKTGQRSKQYAKQSKFVGSNRELRSAMVKIILEKPIGAPTLFKKLRAVRKNISTEEFNKNLADLEREGFIVRAKGILKIAG